MRKLFLLIIIAITHNITYSQTPIEKSVIEKIINRIDKDRISQDSILILKYLKVRIDDTMIGNASSEIMDSLNFVYTGGWNIGFYLLSTSQFNNKAILEIYSRNEDWKKPEKLIKRLYHNSNDSIVSYIFHTTKYPDEWFNLRLKFEKKIPGYAHLIFTVFPQNKNQ